MWEENVVLERLAAQPLTLPPLRFVRREPDHPGLRGVLYEVRWNRSVYRFVAEVKGRSTPQAIIAAAHQAKSLAYDQPGTLPLVVVPYLSPAQLDQIETLDGVSAIDLCGNGLVRAGELLVLRAGRPNQFREVRPLRSVYRGTSSLVARALVLQHEFDRVSAIRELIVSRGGHITLGTVSKVLARLDEELIVERAGKAVRVVQADKLLEQLRQGYRPPRIKARWTGKLPLAEPALHAHFVAASERAGGRLVLTGLASARDYVAVATEPIAAFYCSIDPQALIAVGGVPAEPSRSFPNVELLQTDDDGVFFDPRIAAQRIISSPVQTWLELATGDKRTLEASVPLRARLLDRRANAGG